MSSNLLSDSDLVSPSTTTLDRRKILITGCSSGIGYYCAKKLHADGHIVVAACRKKHDVERLIAEGLHSVQLDLDNSDSIAEGVRNTLTITNGELDVLINNGAEGQPGAVEDLSRPLLEKQFSATLFGAHELTVSLLKTLMKSDKPRIIQMGSVFDFLPWQYRGAYVASKYALRGLSETLRLEFLDTPLRVCIIESGPVYSDFRKNEYKNFIKHIDIHRSRHVDHYKRIAKNFDGENYVYPIFALPPQAIYKKIHHVMYARRPKSHYRVTFATTLFVLSYWLLPRVLLEWALKRLSNNNKGKGFDC